MGLLLFYVALALGVSFLCSVMEAVLLSVSASFVARMEQERPSLGAKLKEFKDNIDQPLAAILSLNTIAHTVGAAGAGAQAAKVFGDAYIGVISAILTFLILNTKSPSPLGDLSAARSVYCTILALSRTRARRLSVLKDSRSRTAT